eukprot:1770531-Prymnesium_polylepis.1
MRRRTCSGASQDGVESHLRTGTSQIASVAQATSDHTCDNTVARGTSPLVPTTAVVGAVWPRESFGDSAANHEADDVPVPGFCSAAASCRTFGWSKRSVEGSNAPPIRTCS